MARDMLEDLCLKMALRGSPDRTGGSLYGEGSLDTCSLEERLIH